MVVHHKVRVWALDKMIFTPDEGIATYPVPKKWDLIARDRVLTLKGEWVTREEKDGV